MSKQTTIEFPPPSVQNFAGTIHHDTYPAISSQNADMAGKSVLVTGASSGCGKAMAISFARAGACQIAILARRDMTELVAQLEQVAAGAGRSKPHVLVLRADQTDQVQVEAAAKQVELEFGSLDVLVNNAGYMEEWKPIAESDPADWWKSWEVNVKGPYLMCRSFIPLLLRGTAKTIVQVTSMGALSTGVGASAYQGTKAAIVRMSNHIRIEYGDQGLLVHNVHPGSVKTELSLTMPSQVHTLLVDTPEMCGDVIVWLTKERREWLQDRFVSSQWDMEGLEARRDEIVSQNLLRLHLRV
ncbi:hypothetical protein DL766_005459 [Monosporascus sp. MC13-8B]|uniref:Uncharacterized protein n=1 Tax=Monosporascus cannonballus TaxID=155416 RepID=A0ABY0HK83_9PEZI|nr:hypothetical protein DL763_006470 [Monosporascus cannonballus]RYO95448.1 hypothetical protein DL762_000010 [Monosporascus cannonballus]RYP29290.1 hypothetical protein DL766_005459 [Monosporascus sp. MC13-8B]